jgi:hypothetical protein
MALASLCQYPCGRSADTRTEIAFVKRSAFALLVALKERGAATQIVWKDNPLIY